MDLVDIEVIHKQKELLIRSVIDVFMDLVDIEVIDKQKELLIRSVKGWWETSLLFWD